MTATDLKPGVYTLFDLCRLFRSDDRDITAAVAAGTLPAPLRIGRRVVFPRRQVDAVLAGTRGPVVMTGTLR